MGTVPDTFRYSKKPLPGITMVALTQHRWQQQQNYIYVNAQFTICRRTDVSNIIVLHIS
jgi:hypothetical protein